MSAPQLQRLKGQGLATGVWIQDQADLSAESVDEFGAVLDALEQPLGAHGELVDGAGEQVAEVALDVRPHALGGVELAGVGRQLDHGARNSPENRCQTIWRGEKATGSSSSPRNGEAAGGRRSWSGATARARSGRRRRSVLRPIWASIRASDTPRQK